MPMSIPPKTEIYQKLKNYYSVTTILDFTSQMGEYQNVDTHLAMYWLQLKTQEIVDVKKQPVPDIDAMIRKYLAALGLQNPDDCLVIPK